MIRVKCNAHFYQVPMHSFRLFFSNEHNKCACFIFENKIAKICSILEFNYISGIDHRSLFETVYHCTRSIIFRIILIMFTSIVLTTNIVKCLVRNNQKVRVKSYFLGKFLLNLFYRGLYIYAAAARRLKFIIIATNDS